MMFLMSTVDLVHKQGLQQRVDFHTVTEPLAQLLSCGPQFRLSSNLASAIKIVGFWCFSCADHAIQYKRIHVGSLQAGDLCGRLGTPADQIWQLFLQCDSSAPLLHVDLTALQLPALEGSGPLLRATQHSTCPLTPGLRFHTHFTCCSLAACGIGCC